MALPARGRSSRAGSRPGPRGLGPRRPARAPRRQRADMAALARISSGSHPRTGLRGNQPAHRDRRRLGADQVRPQGHGRAPLDLDRKSAAEIAEADAELARHRAGRKERARGTRSSVLIGELHGLEPRDRGQAGRAETRAGRRRRPPIRARSTSRRRIAAAGVPPLTPAQLRLGSRRGRRTRRATRHRGRHTPTGCGRPPSARTRCATRRGTGSTSASGVAHGAASRATRTSGRNLTAWYRSNALHIRPRAKLSRRTQADSSVRLGPLAKGSFYVGVYVPPDHYGGGREPTWYLGAHNYCSRIDRIPLFSPGSVWLQGRRIRFHVYWFRTFWCCYFPRRAPAIRFSNAGPEQAGAGPSEQGQRAPRAG